MTVSRGDFSLRGFPASLLGLVVTSQGLHEVSPGEAEVLSLHQFLALFSAPNRLCLGFVARGLPKPSEQLRRHLKRIEKTMSLGWTSVAWTVRGADGHTDQALGAFAPPSAARPHPTSPRGLFLVDEGRWERTWVDGENLSPRSWLDWSEVFYQRQMDLGLIFCDPSIELTSDHEFVVAPWKNRSRLVRALSAIKGIIE